MSHLFVWCPFAWAIIDILLRDFKLSLIWNGPTLLDNIEIWFKKDMDFPHIPLFFICNLWISRNLCLFEEKPLDLVPLCSKSLEQVISFPAVCKKIRKSRNVGNAPDLPYPFGFFDGDATNKIGGVGIFLVIS